MTSHNNSQENRPGNGDNWLLLKRFEQAIVTALLIMMAVVVALATLELAWLIIKDIVTPPVLILEVHELLDIFGIFLLVLIGLELLETIHSYYLDRIIRVEVVIIVAIIAICRKVIILDYKTLTNFTLLHVGAVILALSIGYYLLRRSWKIGEPPGDKKSETQRGLGT
jgi:uncharacterized membrane protein (DUF373 family)